MERSTVLASGALLAVKLAARMTFVEDRRSRHAPVHHRSRPLGGAKLAMPSDVFA